MAEERIEVTQDTVPPPEVAADTASPIENTQAQEAAGASEVADLTSEPSQTVGSEAAEALDTAAQEPSETVAPSLETSEPPKEPDALQPFIDKACETIHHEVDDAELDKFLRAHIKTFREEWDAMSDTAKDAYLHMMTSQLLQRKASTTRIMLYEEFKLPVPSAQTKLFESLKQSQIKPKRCIPVLLMPPNLRPTYSLKK